MKKASGDRGGSNKGEQEKIGDESPSTRKPVPLSADEVARAGEITRRVGLIIKSFGYEIDPKRLMVMSPPPAGQPTILLIHRTNPANVKEQVALAHIIGLLQGCHMGSQARPTKHMMVSQVAEFSIPMQLIAIHFEDMVKAINTLMQQMIANGQDQFGALQEAGLIQVRERG